MYHEIWIDEEDLLLMRLNEFIHKAYNGEFGDV